jgi:ATP-dependent Lon protease
MRKRTRVEAARDAGARMVIVPKENEREVKELPEDVFRGLTLLFVEKAEEAFKEVLL